MITIFAFMALVVCVISLCIVTKADFGGFLGVWLLVFSISIFSILSMNGVILSSCEESLPRDQSCKIIAVPDVELPK